MMSPGLPKNEMLSRAGKEFMRNDKLCLDARGGRLENTMSGRSLDEECYAVVISRKDGPGNTIRQNFLSLPCVACFPVADRRAGSPKN